VRPEALRSVVVSPDGTEVMAPLTDVTTRNAKAKDVQAKAGASTTYEVRHDTVVSGLYELRVYLDNTPICNSPITFEVEPSVAVPQQSSLEPPENEDSLVADFDVPAVAILHTKDRFGNRCNKGGLRASGRLLLVKQGPSDNTILMPNNHSVTVDDHGDGTYGILVAIMMAATVKLIVNMDKDLPGTTGELPPLQLNFTKGMEHGGSTATSTPAAVDAGALSPSKAGAAASAAQHAPLPLAIPENLSYAEALQHTANGRLSPEAVE